MTFKTTKSYLLHALLQLLDYYTTKTAFTLSTPEKSAREINPIIRKLIEKDEWDGIFLIKLAAIAAPWTISKIFIKDKDLRKEQLASSLKVSNVVYLAVVANNLRVIHKLITPQDLKYLQERKDVYGSIEPTDL